MKKLTKKFESIEKTYNEFKDYVELQQVSPFMQIATTAAAVITMKNNVYFGVNIKSDCGLGFCAERNALSTMITCGETKIKYVLCIDRTRNPRLPCGACREFIAQLNPDNLDSEIVTSISPFECVTMKSILPGWWGYEKIERENKNKNKN